MNEIKEYTDKLFKDIKHIDEYGNSSKPCPCRYLVADYGYKYGVHKFYLSKNRKTEFDSVTKLSERSV